MAGLPEADEATGAAGNDDVVEHLDAQQVAGLGGAAGEGDILGRGGGIAAWVVVGQEERGAADAHGFLKQIGHAGVDGVDGALSDLADAEDAMAGIEQHHDQALVAGVVEMAGQHAGGIGRALDGRAFTGGFDLEATGEFESGLDLGCLGQADAVDGGEFVDGGVGEPAEGSEFGQEGLSEFEGAALR